MTIPVDDRIITLLNRLGIDQAHVIGRVASDWHGLAANHPDRVASLALTAPTSMPTENLEAIEPRLLVFASDLVGFGDWIATSLQALPNADLRLLVDYETPLWADVAVDHDGLIEAGLLEQSSRSAIAKMTGADFPQTEGEIVDITYRIHGEGPPLLLLPLGLAPSGWASMVDRLSRHFCVIHLGGPHLGVLPMLEQRGQSTGYRSMMSTLFDKIDLQHGEAVLEVGSGTGVVLRWLAAKTAGDNPLTGLDLSDYLLGEARGLAASDGLAEVINFEFGNAEELPYADNSFDVIFSTTVMEEVNAEKMMTELLRVVRPGGRVGVVVRAMDMPFTLNIPLPPEDLASFTKPSPRTEGEACASASLYHYFQKSGLSDVEFGPFLANFTNAYGAAERYIVGRFISQLEPADAARWETALATADADGTFFLSWPHHLAVGRKKEVHQAKVCK